MDAPVENQKTYMVTRRPRDRVSGDARLRAVGLRPTKQRRALAELLFAHGDRHISAERLHEDAVETGVRVSLATIYNTLNQFTRAGLLRELTVDSNKTYFDTNTTEHHHYFVEENNQVMDMPAGVLSIEDLPEPPDGMEVVRVDVVVRLRRKT